jgi:hypothetical protein
MDSFEKNEMHIFLSMQQLHKRRFSALGSFAIIAYA